MFNSLEEFYDSIPNPIIEPEVFNKLVELQEKNISDKNSTGDIYQYISRAYQNDSFANSRVNNRDYDEFMTFYFNLIKNNILSMTPEQINHRYFISYGDILKQQFEESTNVNSYVDLLKELHNHSAINNIFRNVFIGSFIHIRSCEIGQNEAYPNITDRLYLNVKRENIFKIATILAKEFDEKSLPFYFKIDPVNNRDDSVTIYTNRKDLLTYINLLSDLKQKYPIFNECGKTPILTGPIDEWIGYGAEPHLLSNGKKTSFNGIRSDIISKSFKQLEVNWLENHHDFPVKMSNQVMNINDYFKLIIPIAMFNDLVNEAKKNGTYDPTYYNQDLLNEIINYIKENYQGYVDAYIKGINLENRNVYYNGRNNNINQKIFNSNVGKNIFYFMKSDPNFIYDFNDLVNKYGEEVGISDNFCFNTDTIELFRQIDQMSKETAMPEISSEKTVQRANPFAELGDFGHVIVPGINPVNDVVSATENENLENKIEKSNTESSELRPPRISRMERFHSNDEETIINEETPQTAEEPVRVEQELPKETPHVDQMDRFHSNDEETIINEETPQTAEEPVQVEQELPKETPRVSRMERFHSNDELKEDNESMIKPSNDFVHSFPNLTIDDNSLRERRFNKMIAENRIVFNKEFIDNHYDEVMNSPILLKELMTSDNKEAINSFVNMVNEKQKQGLIDEDKYHLLRSNYVLGNIIGNYQKNPDNDKNKVQFIYALTSLIRLNDNQTVVNALTNEYFVSQILNNTDIVYRYWIDNNVGKNLSLETLSSIINTIVVYGDNPYLNLLEQEYQNKIKSSESKGMVI